MKINLPEQIDKKQWLHRLGVKGDADLDLMHLLEQAQVKLFEAAAPQGVFRLLSTDAFELPGSAIKKHLAECSRMVVMAVTLGAGIDRLIRTAQIRDMAEAVILDSGASILAEQCADVLEKSVHSEIGFEEGRALYFTGRYSPGYGDFPVEMQKQLLKAVDGTKAIGLTASENHILIPRKSITAIIGTADHPVTGYQATCDECLIKGSCGLRKEGKLCWT